MAASQETVTKLTVEEKEARKLAKLESDRINKQLRYATDTEYRERLKAANRENGAKKRAAARQERLKANPSELSSPPKAGRPRRSPLAMPSACDSGLKVAS